MKRIMMILMFLTAGILFFGMGQEKVRAATEPVDLNINSGSSTVLRSSQTYRNVCMTEGGILKTEAKTEQEDKITVTVNGDFSISKADGEEEASAVIDLSDNSEMVITGDFVVDDGVQVEIQGAVTICGNVQIGKDAQLDIISGDFRVIPEVSLTETPVNEYIPEDQQKPETDKVFKNLGTVRINRTEAALLVDGRYGVETSEQGETGDVTNREESKQEQVESQKGIFLFSSCEENAGGENDKDSGTDVKADSGQWIDAIECQYGQQPNKVFEKMSENNQINKSKIYKFAETDLQGWNVTEEGEYKEYWFTYKQSEDGSIETYVNSQQPDEKEISGYANIWFCQKVRVVPAKINYQGTETFEIEYTTEPNETTVTLGWETDILNKAEEILKQVEESLNKSDSDKLGSFCLTAVKLPDNNNFQNIDSIDIPDEFIFEIGKHEFKFWINYNENSGEDPGNYNPIEATVTVTVAKGEAEEPEEPDIPDKDDPSKPSGDNKPSGDSKPTPGDPTVETPKPPVSIPEKPAPAVPSSTSEGKCGNAVTYHYKNGVLTISGNGDMTDLACENTETLEQDASAGRKSSYGGMDAYAVKTKKIVIEGGVTRIGRGAFAYFKNLESVQIKGSKKAKVSVGQYAFAGCEKLKKVSMKNVKEINFFAFGRCKSLKKLTLSKGLTNIEKSAFYGCKKLKTVNLPSTVKKIGDYCFYGCKKLKTVKVNGNIKKAGKYMFYGAGKKVTIRCANKKANKCKFVKKAKAEGIRIKRK